MRVVCVASRRVNGAVMTLGWRGVGFKIGPDGCPNGVAAQIGHKGIGDAGEVGTSGRLPHRCKRGS